MSYGSLSSRVQDIIDAAIKAEMRFYGYYPTGDGGYQASAGLGYAPPPIDGPGGEDPGPIIPNQLEGGSINPSDIYAKWAERIPSLFEPYLELPEPSSFASQAEQALTAMERLSSGGVLENGNVVAEANTALTKAGDVADTLGNFHGRTSDKFKTWLGVFEAVTTNQCLAVQVLRGCLSVEEEMWTRLREDVSSLADSSVSAFDGAGGFTVGDVKAIIKVVGSVATVAGWFPPAAPAAGAASKAVWVADLLVATYGPEQKENPLQARGVEDIWAKMQDAEQKLRDYLKTQEDDVASCLDKMLSRIQDKDTLTPTETSQGMEAGYTMPKRKGLSGATTENEVISDEAEVLVKPWELRGAADKLRNMLAPQMETARDAIDPFPTVGIWEREAGLGHGPAKGAYAEYSGVAYYLMHSMEDAATELRAAADVLDEIAEMWGQVDDAVNGELERIHRELEARTAPPPSVAPSYGGRPRVPYV